MPLFTKMKKMKKCVFMMMALLGMAAISCDSNEKNSRVEIWLTDAPGDYEAVNIDVVGVEINAEASGDAGWKSIDIHSGVYNLLDLTNGNDTLLGSIDLPAGKIEQIRLKLGDNNSIVVGGVEHELTIPSGSQSGLKINVHETFVDGIIYKILLDFDVARSVVVTGNSNYKLKPVIRAIAQAETGAIEGTVDPAESTPAIYALQNSDTLGTTYSDSTGHFLLRGLAAGTYTVIFAPNDEYNPAEKTDVDVQVGTVKDLGTIEITKK